MMGSATQKQKKEAAINWVKQSHLASRGTRCDRGGRESQKIELEEKSGARF